MHSNVSNNVVLKICSYLFYLQCRIRNLKKRAVRTHYFFPFFPKNCMKLKEIGLRSEAHFPSAPFDPSMNRSAKISGNFFLGGGIREWAKASYHPIP